MSITNEVAEIIGIPQKAVKTPMFYARKQIAHLIAAQGRSPGII